MNIVDPGYYIIVCAPNARAYIGATANIDRRLSQHRTMLETGKHSIAELQADWDRYGATAFLFERLYSVESTQDGLDSMIEGEISLMDALDSTFYLYNVQWKNGRVRWNNYRHRRVTNKKPRPRR